MSFLVIKGLLRNFAVSSREKKSLKIHAFNSFDVLTVFNFPIACRIITERINFLDERDISIKSSIFPFAEMTTLRWFLNSSTTIIAELEKRHMDDNIQ